jgi:dishevelled associated activator of morphogenesis
MNKKSELKELIELREMTDSLKKEINELKIKLHQNEIKLKAAQNEKEIQMNNYDELKRILNDEINTRKKYEAQLKNLEYNIQKGATSQSNSDTDSVSTASSSLPSPPAPPPPPPPPPPPASLFGGLKNQKNVLTKPKKNVPKSNVQMKCFNWSKIDHLNSKDSLWKNINEEPLYNMIDLDEFEKSFSMIQSPNKKPYSSDVDSIPYVSLSRLQKPKKDEFSFMEKKRANAVEIFLSILKLSNQELTDIIYSMDSNEKISGDVVEQLVNFVPSDEETKKLQENRHEFENFQKADRFLYEMSKIYRLKQKLQCLIFKKKFNEKYTELKNKVDKISQSCNILMSSKNIVELLRIVLCMGNYMNQTNRNGDACGFSISNLKKLIDVKSTTDTSFSLLHFLVSTVESKVIILKKSKINDYFNN